MKWLKFFLSHSIFIAFCSVALCVQTYIILHLTPDYHYLAFVFFATLCSYNFYWLISKYSFNRRTGITAFARRNGSYIIVFLVAIFGMLCFLFLLGTYFLFISAGVMFTLLYSLPLWPFKFVSFTQKAGFLKPVLLAFTWAWITVVVPAIPLPGVMFFPILVLLSARFFFMLLLCIIFDMRDVNVDKIHGLHTLATDVSKPVLQRIIYVVFFLYLFNGTFVRYFFHDAHQVIAFVVTGLLVWLIYILSLKPRGYFFYYFLVDGLMIISPIATYIASN